ncbi:hypothetical protein BH09PLA1_BH09PLA1_13100 [soil metagenome]
MMVIAVREYAAAVKTKAFLVSLILFPLMMGGSTLVQVMTKKYGADITPRTIAIVDRTPGQALFHGLQLKVEDRNKNKIFDSDTGRQTEPVFTLKQIEPCADTEDAIARQRLELSDRVRKKEIFAFIELGKNMLEVPKSSSSQPSNLQKALNKAASGDEDAIMAAQEKSLDENAARYTSNSPTYTLVQRWAQQALGGAVSTRRLQPFAKGLSQEQMLSLMIPPALVTRSLAVSEPDGTVGYEVTPNQIVSFVLPVALVILMFMIVLVGSSPMTMNVMEEKQLRIAEVLLGSVRPFDLMMGKLLGGVGVALTLLAIYLSGAYYAAGKMLPGDMKVNQILTPQLMIWFVLFCVISVFMYGALFVAVGAAVSNAKEAQSFITPVMLVVILPTMMLVQIIQSPSGALGMIFGFLPTSAPMVMMARLAIPPGIPTWQPVVAMIGVAITTIILVWAAGRIFRIGILMQGQGAKPLEMLKWVVRG